MYSILTKQVGDIVNSINTSHFSVDISTGYNKYSSFALYPETNQNIYNSFALYPQTHYPSGMVNVSRINSRSNERFYSCLRIIFSIYGVEVTGSWFNHNNSHYSFMDIRNIKSKLDYGWFPYNLEDLLVDPLKYIDTANDPVLNNFYETLKHNICRIINETNQKYMLANELFKENLAVNDISMEIYDRWLEIVWCPVVKSDSHCNRVIDEHIIADMFNWT